MASRKYTQRTFTVPEYGKITIKTSVATSVGNLAGWYVRINGTRFFVNVLRQEDAEDRAYVRWVNEVGGQS